MILSHPAHGRPHSSRRSSVARNWTPAQAMTELLVLGLGACAFITLVVGPALYLTIG